MVELQLLVYYVGCSRYGVICVDLTPSTVFLIGVDLRLNKSIKELKDESENL